MVRIQYFIKLKLILNLKKPKRFTEKIQWYKLNYRSPLMKQCSDKFKVREYIKSKGLEKILNKLYGVYNSVEEIPFDDLPQKCVIKTSNGSSTNLFYESNSDFNVKKEKKQLNQWMKQKLYLSGREWCYKNSKPTIIIENFLENNDDSFNGISDYKILCFNGEAKYVVFDIDRFTDHKRNIYDSNWNYLDISTDYPNFGNSVPKPEKLSEMIEIANKLSSDFPFVRVDLYLVDSKIIFGELTFYPWSGYVGFDPDSFDFQLGNFFKLSL